MLIADEVAGTRHGFTLFVKVTHDISNMNQAYDQCGMSQVECWLTTLGVGLACKDLERRLLEVPQSAAWHKVLCPNDLEVDSR